MSCCGGSSRVKVSPDPCNAASVDGQGRLLVPEVVIEVVGDDLRVTPPADGACPAVWRIEKVQPFALSGLLPFVSVATAPNGVWAKHGGDITVPHDGLYQLDLSAHMAVVVAGAGNALIGMRLTLNGAVLPGPDPGESVIQQYLGQNDPAHGQTNSQSHPAVSLIRELKAGDVIGVEVLPQRVPVGGQPLSVPNLESHRGTLSVHQVSFL